MDLPTYTSIWRIEKRLYKLYDFRLPMPLPIGQVTVFAAIIVPYVVLLTVLGLPFNHTLIWLYILPPGLATWLVTRPVLESKRLPELIRSQLRYLAEPRILCRMAPLSERDVVVVTGRIWRPRAGRRQAEFLDADAVDEVAAEEFAEMPAGSTGSSGSGGSGGRVRGRLRKGSLPPARSRDSAPSPAADPASPGALPSRIAAASQPAGARASRQPADAERAREVRRVNPAEFRLAASGRPAQPRMPVPYPAHTPGPQPAAGRPRVEVNPMPPEPATTGMDRTPITTERDGCPADTGSARDSAEAPVRVAQHERPDQPDQPEWPPAEQSAAAQSATGQPAWPARPAVTVVGAGAAKTAAPSVERALAGPSARRGDVRAGRVAVVPGGHRPGKPDLLQRDRARAQQPIGIRPRILMLGCTVGAGQTTTTLLTGEVLASLRQDQVAAMDLNPGPGSLARRAEARPAPSQAALTGRSRLVVIGPRTAAGGNEAAAMPRDPAVDAITFEAATDRYDLVLADPATVAVPRLLAVADQLVLVAPASSAAPGAIAMTFEWLEAHGQSELAAGSIMVLNGVSRRSAASVEQSERVCAGRCRAIVRIPWDDQLQSQVPRRAMPTGPSAQLRQHWTGVLNAATAAAYTALAGVLVAGLAGQGDQGQGDQGQGGHGTEHEPAHAGQAGR